MKTYTQLNTILENAKKQIHQISATTFNEYQIALEKIFLEVRNSFSKAMISDPISIQVNRKMMSSGNAIQNFLTKVVEASQERFSVRYIPYGVHTVKLQGAFIECPTVCEYTKPIHIDYNDGNVDVIENFILSFLLQLPVDKIHLNIVNLRFSSLLSSLKEVAEAKGTYISEQTEVEPFMEKLYRYMVDSVSQVDYPSLCEDNRKIIRPYELTIFIDEKGALEDVFKNNKKIDLLLEKGMSAGLYFITLYQMSSQAPNMFKSLQNLSSYLQILPYKKATDSTVSYTPICNDPALVSSCINLLSTQSNQKQQLDWERMIEEPYTRTNSDLIAPIGWTSDGAEFNFRQDINKSHYHSFLLGGTGSGKSRFLHNLILNLATKYSPQDLELYLLDFKGVELNCYKELKHVRALLVDYADERITYEVIMDLKKQIQRRQHLLAALGASDVDEYNRVSQSTRLSQIILIVDECQVLFADRAQNSRLLNEIVDVIALIAQQGRAYGIHLLLSTQSLSNTPQLGAQILNQISEHYILPCLPKDAVRLVPESEQRTTEKIVTQMEKNKGQCYYQGAEQNILFTFNYVAKGETQNQLVNKISQKANSHSSNGQVYFSGSLQFELDQTKLNIISSTGRNNIVASMGQEINLGQSPLTIPLKKDYAENILLLGLNDSGEPVTRTMMNTLVSLILTNKTKNLNYQFLVFDCYGDEAAEYSKLLRELELNDYCKVVNGRKRCEALKQLCEEIKSESNVPTVLFIIGQERFSELKRNIELPTATTSESSQQQFQNVTDLMLNLGNQASSIRVSSSDIKTTKDAIEFLLKNGGEHSVHIVMQLDKPDHFLFPDDGYVNRKRIFEVFKHLILLHSEDRVASQLGLSDNIRLDQLSSDVDKLRAYYYNDEVDRYTLFTPYLLPTYENISKLICPNVAFTDEINYK